MKSWILGGMLFVCGAMVGAVGVGSAQAERQPMMQKALRNLEEARNNLQEATEDKGGHRMRAKQHIEQAIGEVQKGIAFDNRR